MAPKRHLSRPGRVSERAIGVRLGAECKPGIAKLTRDRAASRQPREALVELSLFVVMKAVFLAVWATATNRVEWPMKREHRIDEWVKIVEDQIRRLCDFDAADIYISRLTLTGIAIDRGRRELLLVDEKFYRRFPLSSVFDCEILEDDVPLVDASLGRKLTFTAAGGMAAGLGGALAGGLLGQISPSAGNVKKVVLRFVTDDFDKPSHDLVLLDRSHGNKGVRRDDVIYKEALEAAELWHRRVVGMMIAAD